MQEVPVRYGYAKATGKTQVTNIAVVHDTVTNTVTFLLSNFSQQAVVQPDVFQPQRYGVFS